MISSSAVAAASALPIVGGVVFVAGLSGSLLSSRGTGNGPSDSPLVRTSFIDFVERNFGWFSLDVSPGTSLQIA